MPIYEYKCPKCGIFEAIQSFSEKPLKCKPDCEEKGCPKKAERLISQSAFHLKGGGWYKDGYSSTASANKSTSTSTSSGGSDSASSSSSDSGSGDSDSGGKKKKEKDATAKPAKCGSGCGCH